MGGRIAFVWLLQRLDFVYFGFEGLIVARLVFLADWFGWV